MKRGLFLLLTLTLACPVVVPAAEDLTFAREGAPEKRQHLDALEGKPAPALQVTDWLNGKPATLADLKGKLVVLDFWATWCGPCIASIPHNNELAAKYKDQDVVFVGVCHQQGVEKMGRVVKDKGIRYPTAKDADGATVKAYHVNSFPDYYIIDKKGMLRVADCQNRKVEEVIKKLLAER